MEVTEGYSDYLDRPFTSRQILCLDVLHNWCCAWL